MTVHLTIGYDDIYISKGYTVIMREIVGIFHVSHSRNMEICGERLHGIRRGLKVWEFVAFQWNLERPREFHMGRQ